VKPSEPINQANCTNAPPSSTAHDRPRIARRPNSNLLPQCAASRVRRWHSCAVRWISAYQFDRLPVDAPLSVELDGVVVCLVRTCDKVFAINDECTHAEIPLSEGDVDHCEIECFLHGSRFDLRTGAVLNPPATRPVMTFPVRIVDGDVQVALP